MPDPDRPLPHAMPCPEPAGPRKKSRPIAPNTPNWREMPPKSGKTAAMPLGPTLGRQAAPNKPRATEARHETGRKDRLGHRFG